MALHSLYCADVPLRNCSLTHSSTVQTLLKQAISRGCSKEDPGGRGPHSKSGPRALKYSVTWLHCAKLVLVLHCLMLILNLTLF